MNTIRVCDIREVKPGEHFMIDKATAGFQKLGLWNIEQRALTIEGGYLRDSLEKRPLLRMFDVTKYKQLYGREFPKQAVNVIDLAKIPAVHLLTQMHLGKPNDYTGADPEVFVVRGKKPSLLPAWKFLPTQKEAKIGARKPRDNYDYPPKNQQSYAYRDGFAAEYFVYPVACHSYVVDYVRDGLKRVRDAAKKYDDTAKLTIRNTFPIPALTMNAGKDEDIALGCKPSANAYGDDPVLPTDARKFKLRFAGGHVHLGINGLDKDKALNIVKACDIMAAIPAVAMFASIDTPIRRQYYGRAGEFRMPKHGVEYRVLSNAWLCAPAITHLIFNLVRVGAKIGYYGHLNKLDIAEEKVREIINFCDVDAARKWTESHKDLYVKLLTSDGAQTSQKAWTMVTQGGVEALYKEIDDIPNNWHFDDGKWASHSEGDKCDWGKMCRSLA